MYKIPDVLRTTNGSSDFLSTRNLQLHSNILCIKSLLKPIN